MASFDPGAAVSGEVEVPSADYLLRAVWFKREQNKAGDGEYLRVKWEIVAGNHTKATFFANMSCKIHVDGVAARWRSISKGLDITEAFEVGGAQGDKDFSRLVMNRPFKARVARTEDGEWINYDIQRTYDKSTWTEGEHQAIKDLAAELGLSPDEGAPATEASISDVGDDQIPF